MLGKNLKDLRIKKGVTQDDMAELLNIKRQTYSAYERGVSLPDVTSLLKMAEFFGVSVDEILGNKQETALSGQPLSQKTKDLIASYADLSEEELDKVIEYVDFLKTKRNS